jgi:hypothetical protein
MHKTTYLNLMFGALLSCGTFAASASDDVTATEPKANQTTNTNSASKDQTAENAMLKQHATYRRGLAQQERSTAANFLANGKSILQNKHIAIAARQDALADAYEKALVTK